MPLWEGINVDLKATNVKLTDELYGYVVTKVTNLGKLLKKIQEKGADIRVHFEVAKTTRHHQSGERLFRADCTVSIAGMSEFYGSAEEQDIFAAIDIVKDRLFREIRRSKNRKRALWKRGALQFKNMLKGIIK